VGCARVDIVQRAGCGGGRTFRLGFVGGLAHYLSSLYWLLAIPDTFHGIPIGPAAAWFF